MWGEMQAFQKSCYILCTHMGGEEIRDKPESQDKDSLEDMSISLCGGCGLERRCGSAFIG